MDLNAVFKYYGDVVDHSLLYYVVLSSRRSGGYYESVLTILLKNIIRQNIAIDNDARFIINIGLNDFHKKLIKRHVMPRIGGAVFNSKSKDVDDLADTEEDENGDDKPDSNSAYDYFVKRI